MSQHGTKLPQKVASVLDPALDLMAMEALEIRDYWKSRDPALVKVRAGALLTWFHVQYIPTDLYQSFVATAPSESERRQRAFMVGVTKIENLIDTNGDRRPVIAPSGETVTGKRVFQMDELNLISPAYVDEIGGVVNTFSFLPRGSAVSCPLSDICRSALGDRVSRDVEDLRTAATPTSDEAKAQPDRTSSSDGAEPTAAPAMESLTA